MTVDEISIASFREHLRCFSVVRAEARSVLPSLTKAIERHGEVTRHRAEGVAACLRHLRPIMSFPTRHVLVGLGNEWSLVACNMRFEDAGAPADAVGRALGVLSLSVSARERERRFTISQQGQTVRQVECFQEANYPWEFRERGSALEFEDTTRYLRRLKKSRLTVDDVMQAFSNVTGLPFVDFASLVSAECYTFETPTSTLLQPPVEFVTLD